MRSDRVSRQWWKVAFVLALLFTIAMLCAPGSAVLSLKVWVASWLPFAQMLDQANVSEHSDKWVHLSLFSFLGTLAARIWGAQAVFKAVMLWLLGLAVVTEGLQHYIPGRDASVADLLADALGLAMGSAALLVLQRREYSAAGKRARAFAVRKEAKAK